MKNQFHLKYSTLDAVREYHLYYFPLNVPLIQMQKYFTVHVIHLKYVPVIQIPLNDVIKESSTSSLIYLLPIFSDKNLNLGWSQLE